MYQSMLEGFQHEKCRINQYFTCHLPIYDCYWLKNHVTIIPPLLDVAKRDGWLSVLFAGGIIFFWLFY